MKIKHILFPVDFSERCATAVPFVGVMAERQAARVTLLTVVHPHYAGGLAGAPVVDLENLQERARRHLEGLYQTEFGGVTVDRVAVVGDPGPAIAHYADEHDVDLIMLPTHGHGPFRQLLLGSVSAKVLHDAHCAVWTDAHTEDAPDQLHLRMQSVLCAVDASDDSVRVMRKAADLAKGLNAKMRLIHAVPGMEAWPERQISPDVEEEIREAAREKILRLEKLADISVPLCVSSGTVADIVREEALQHGSDLVVIGRGVIQGTLGRLRTLAHAIIRNSPCPVISV